MRTCVSVTSHTGFFSGGNKGRPMQNTKGVPFPVLHKSLCTGTGKQGTAANPGQRKSWPVRDGCAASLPDSKSLPSRLARPLLKSRG